MKVSKDWWKRFFNEFYLITDARSVCDYSLTRRETDLLEKTLGLDKQDKILDLCGGYGRHSLELARRGYQNLAVLDSSRYLIGLGKELAKDIGLKVRFHCRDARFSGLKSTAYSAVFIMANSFGYFASAREDLRILEETYRLLKGGGKILLDLSDSDYVRRHLQPISWHQANKDIFVLRKRKLQGDMIKAREMVISKKTGVLKDGSYCERLYNKERITRLLRKIGFQKPAIKKNLTLHRAKKDYGLLTSRMLVIAEKIQK